MEVLLGFLTGIAAQLLKLTYLNRTKPEAPAETVLRPVQLEVLKAQFQRKKALPPTLTVAWAIQAVARKGRLLRASKKNRYWHYRLMARVVAIRVFM